MDHVGDWMLPGAALAFVVIAGIVLVALDDIVTALLSLRRKGAALAAVGSGVEAPGANLNDGSRDMPGAPGAG